MRNVVIWLSRHWYEALLYAVVAASLVVIAQAVVRVNT